MTGTNGARRPGPQILTCCRWAIALGVIAMSACGAVLSLAAEPKSIPRILPPKGIEVPDKDRERLQKEVDELAGRLEKAKDADRAGKLDAHLPDIEVYLKAVDYALRHGEFYHPREIGRASELLKTANKRLQQVQKGEAPWASQRGLVVRGYRSKLDDSAQPYGLVIPQELDLAKPQRLYVWLHGRGDTATDANFIYQREHSVGQISPADGIVLHPFGRYCNAFKFAGEVDVFEAIESVKKNYKIDPDRIVLWGFSMGGAGTWLLGSHHPDAWCAMSPGAGFVDTRRYQSLQPAKYPPWYEQALWGLFDVPDYTENLFNLPVVAYSGELDKQRAAAELMAEAFKEHGQTLRHLIGPRMGHKYHPDTLAELSKILAGHADKGIDHHPKKITLQTRTLRYNKIHWLEVLGLEEHWKDSRVVAEATDDSRLTLTTKNVSALRLTKPWRDRAGFDRSVSVTIDGQQVDGPADSTPASLSWEKVDGRWELRPRIPVGSELRKYPGQQGPIDDVFMEPFLVVAPTGKSTHPAVERWVGAELEHFKERWRHLFRGELRIKNDVDVTDADIQKYHLILWGDRESNQLIGKVADYLPVRWTRVGVQTSKSRFDSSKHVLAAIYPNPLQQRPNRYVVLNSGMTFREGHDRTNSLQNPKLPDWAVIDISEAADNLKPGRIADAGFFDEKWQLKPPGPMPEFASESK